MTPKQTLLTPREVAAALKRDPSTVYRWIADGRVPNVRVGGIVRAQRHLFPGLEEGTMRDAIGRASRAAKIPLYSPHDLRHRRGSLWHAGGMPARELAARMGHSKASMSLDVYTHVMPPEEADTEALSALLVMPR